MTEKNVLVTDYTWSSTEPEASVLARVGARLLIAKTGDEDELVSLAPKAVAILTCFAQVTAKVIKAGNHLEVIGRYGIGVDNIAVDQASRQGIPVTNVPAYCLDEVAEHTLALILSSARKLRVYDSAVRDGDWALKTGMPMFRIRGRVMGILGFGKIGQSVADKARGLGVRIIAYDPYLPKNVFGQHETESVGLDELFVQSDFLSVHMPLTTETRSLVNEDRLRRMKPTAFLVNTSRGGVIDQDALYLALRGRWIAGAALDVFEPEKLSADHPLLNLPNLIATPHVAFYSEESVLDLETKAAENVADILSGRRPAAVVNPTVFDLPRWAHLREG